MIWGSIQCLTWKSQENLRTSSFGRIVANLVDIEKIIQFWISHPLVGFVEPYTHLKALIEAGYCSTIYPFSSGFNYMVDQNLFDLVWLWNRNKETWKKCEGKMVPQQRKQWSSLPHQWGRVLELCMWPQSKIHLGLIYLWDTRFAFIRQGLPLLCRA